MISISRNSKGSQWKNCLQASLDFFKNYFSAIKNTTNPTTPFSEVRRNFPLQKFLKYQNIFEIIYTY